jgi:formylmethanofuran dehydrogenase subunit C
MNAIALTLREGARSSIPIEAEAITPDRLRDLDQAAIERLPLRHGNQEVVLAEIFTVRGGRSDEVRAEGDLSNVKSLGAGMTSGRLVVDGSAGMHIGARMRGGSIEVRGDAGDWAGAEMTGGLLHVRGGVGNRAGSAYRGSKFGMRGGVILVEGSGGHEVAGYMRRGLVAVRGDVQDHAGARMVSGTLLVLGKAGGRLGGGMKRGTIVCGEAPEMLATFRSAGPHEALFLRPYLGALSARGFAMEALADVGSFARWRGDLAELGLGEILVARPDSG